VRRTDRQATKRNCPHATSCPAGAHGWSSASTARTVNQVSPVNAGSDAGNGTECHAEPGVPSAGSSNVPDSSPAVHSNRSGGEYRSSVTTIRSPLGSSSKEIRTGS
jgi:hypothetical protein